MRRVTTARTSYYYLVYMGYGIWDMGVILCESTGAMLARPSCMPSQGSYAMHVVTSHTGLMLAAWVVVL